MAAQKYRDLQREWNEQRSKPHMSVDDRYDMLVLRDKIIRTVTANNNGDTESAMDDVVIIGICPEICPEKERYERNTRNLVDSFERRTRMIKDFSRQAADQDMPLPTELRTPQALRATMDFLLREIISDPPANPESPSGWYDFVWRRVRAIRKEITQQRLTGPVIAGILEDMCRFHIISFHMFSEADSNQFAPKLNLENLNDALATLGRIYEELDAKNESSPNAPEFLAYEMMVRVWTGKLDLMKTTADVAKLPEVMRNSKELDFARKVISAVNNRFFAEYLLLMKKADYVTACLMHYYAPNVQAKALDFLAVASGARSKTSNTKLPTDFFAGLLGLPTEADLTRFTSYHGLLYEPGSDSIFFPMGFIRSRDPKQYPRTRSPNLVDNKMQGRNLAEIVGKRPLAQIPVPDIVEIDSFDQNGVYVGDNPFTVSFEKENRTENAFRPPHVAKVIPFSRPPVKSQIPDSRPAFPRTPTPYRRPTITSPGPRFPIVPSTSQPFFPGNSSFFQTPPVPTSSERKRARPPSIDSDEDVGDVEPKRRHHDPPATPGPQKPAFSTPASQITPRSPVLSRQTSKSTPGNYSPFSTTASHPDEGPSSFVKEEEKVYPLGTHMQVIRGRTVCQASGMLGVIFRAWYNHATRHRRPSDYFGPIDPSAEQRQTVEHLERKRLQDLVWLKYPIRSGLLTPTNGISTGDLGTILILFVTEQTENEMKEWLRTKLGDPDPCSSNPIRILTYEENNRKLRLVFASVQRGNRKAVYQISSALEPASQDINGAVLFVSDSYSLSTSKDILNQCDIRAGIPITILCHDNTITPADLEAELTGHLILDIFVPELEPNLPLSEVLWECLITVIQRRLPPVFPKHTTLLQLITELYCNFLKLTRMLKRETREKTIHQHTGLIWNNLVEEHCSEKMVEVFVDSQQTCDKLVDLIQNGRLTSFLKVSEEVLWETPGRYPEIFPWGLTEEMRDFSSGNYDVYAGIAEKVLSLSAMASVCDPVVRWKSRERVDLELQLKNWLEKLEDDISDSQSASTYSSYSESSCSLDQEKTTRGTQEGRKKVYRIMMDSIRHDTHNLKQWLTKISRDLKKLDGF